MPADTSLAAHTPSPAYVNAAMRRRVLQLLGADAKLVNTLAPQPYKSEYPFSNKLLDGAITEALDPIVKPLSLEGKLAGFPVLKKLSTELADRGYFQKYPKGGIGIGGGGGSGSDGEGPGATSPGADQPNQPGPDIDIATDPTAPNAETGFGAAATGRGPGESNISAAAASTPTFGGALGGGWGSFVSTAMSVLGSIAGLSGFGLAGAGLGMGINAANSEAQALAGRLGISQSDAMAALAAAKGGEGGSRAGGGFQSGGSDLPPEMSNVSPTASPGASVPGKSPISSGTRANAAARVGGGISPSFLEVLEGMR